MGGKTFLLYILRVCYLLEIKSPSLKARFDFLKKMYSGRLCSSHVRKENFSDWSIYTQDFLHWRLLIRPHIEVVS